VVHPLQIDTLFSLPLIDTHTNTVPAPPHPVLLPTMSQEVHRHLTEAGPAALDVANRRFRLVEAYQQHQQAFYEGAPPRTLRAWVARFRGAEARWGCGCIGLLPRTNAPGNRTPKAPEPVP